MALEALYVPSWAPWVSAFRSEHDDQVYALGLIGQLLDTILPGQHPPKPDLKKVDNRVACC
jgi:hypothetical protein